MLGDINNDGVINSADKTMLSNAIGSNYTHSSKTESGLVEHPNGGLTGEQADRASLHRTGYVSNVDTILLNGYLEYKVGHPTATMEDYITYVDTKSAVRDRDDMINYIRQQARTFKVYQLEYYFKNGSLHNHFSAGIDLCSLDRMTTALTNVIETSIQYLYTLTDEELTTDFIVVETASSLNPSAEQSSPGWLLGPYVLHAEVGLKVYKLTQEQIDAIKADYWPAGELPETVTAGTLASRLRVGLDVRYAAEFYGREV